jgi:hypothetical protein
MFQDLFHSDNANVNATLDVLNHDYMKSNKKRDKFQAVGGCSALVYRMQNCLDKAFDEFPACDQVTELKERAELTTLNSGCECTVHWIIVDSHPTLCFVGTVDPM